MSHGVNRVVLVGYTGQEPELRYTQSGTAICQFSVATTENRRVRDEWKEFTEWHRVVVWGKRGEWLGKNLDKGALVAIEGRLQTRSWEDKNGSKRYATEVHAERVTPLVRGRGHQEQDGDSGEGAWSAPTDEPASGQHGGDGFGDLPF